ncbi:MAG TPA: UDP-N-acetylmuramoyl-L-alanyl-D-glutamate--2,6-diaminopimelate ligase [Marmoricola sp.]|nr:UDP-N-acetylmuramoyl-L-alanyl-D-glutamate--2,6-diaminopimelate ligase [Marmoricola sp.]
MAALVGATTEGADVEITGVSLSTSRVSPGDLYAALAGTRVHGARFAADAVAAGARAILTDAEGAQLAAGLAPIIEVAEPRKVLGAVAAEIYRHPSDRLRMLGVTGTQGKTTTTRLLEAALGVIGAKAGVIGTVGTRINGVPLRTALTTPEAPDLQGLLAMMCEAEVEACAMEVSSHALVLGRVDGVVFDVAAFTNLGRDHLDFHATVEEYFEAKADLFTPKRSRRGLVNIDDEHGRLLIERGGIPMNTFSTEGAEATWQAVDVSEDAQGSIFRVLGPDGLDVITSINIPGIYNVSNALCAFAMGVEAGFAPADLAVGLASVSGVPGRLERVRGGGPGAPAVYVDYAHKPDAVSAALRALRPLTDGSLVIVLGAGGDRDSGKRALMGAAAAELADRVIVTDDNPRSEDPALIREAVAAGARAVGAAQVQQIADRREAIMEAISTARTGDVVVIAGKGHETGQEIAGIVHPFDDGDEARAALEMIE